MIGRRMMPKHNWADDPITADGIDPQDYRYIGRLRMSRSYNVASDREVTWRHVRAVSSRANHRMSGDQFDDREARWDKETQRFTEMLAERSRIKHDFEPLGNLGFCAHCGEREDARVEEIGYGTSVMRRVHTNPVLRRVA